MKKLMYQSVLILFFIIVFSVCSCRKSIRKEKGYLVRFMPKVFNFIPTKNMQIESSTASFYSSNFEKGFQFLIDSNITEELIANMDTIKYRNLYKGSYFTYDFIYLTPVEIEFKDIPIDKQNSNMDETHNFKMEIDGKEIIFYYDFRDYEVIKITPLKTNYRIKLNNEDKIIMLHQDSLLIHSIFGSPPAKRSMQ
jgi:hypothetical protein